LYYRLVTPWFSFPAALPMTACPQTRPVPVGVLPFPTSNVCRPWMRSISLFKLSGKDRSISTPSATAILIFSTLICQTPFLFLCVYLMLEDPPASPVSCSCRCSASVKTLSAVAPTASLKL
jgi:hypothetical protein